VTDSPTLTLQAAQDATLVAAFQIPLGAKAAHRLADVLIEHPEHTLAVEGPWLNVWKVPA
jgi:hypothetical protein